MKYSIVCTVEKESQADKIVHTLKQSGFHKTDISLLIPDKTDVRDMQHELGKSHVGISPNPAPVLIGSLSWLSPVGLVAVPGVGAVVAAGPLLKILGKPAIQSGQNWVTQSLTAIGYQEPVAKDYENKLTSGRILLSVLTEKESEIQEAEQIFKSTGAKDISRCSEPSLKEHN